METCLMPRKPITAKYILTNNWTFSKDSIAHLVSASIREEAPFYGGDLCTELISLSKQVNQKHVNPKFYSPIKL